MKKIFYIITALSIVFTSCKKQLEVDLLSQINSADAYKTREAVNAGINGVYSGLKGTALYGRALIVFPEALADNGVTSNNSGRLVNEVRNIRGAHFDTWVTSYYWINQINILSEALNGVSPAPSAAEKSRWEGELAFLRALLYFDLVKVYAYIPTADIPAQNFGGVPLMLTAIKTGDVALAAKPARATVPQVYDQVIADLNVAIAKLPAYSAATVGYANRSAAQALLARVALYKGDYALAKTNADAVILANGGLLTNATNYVNGWRAAQHPESLFEVKFAIAAESIGVNESLQSSFTQNSPSPGWGDLGASPSLFTSLGITIANIAGYNAGNANSVVTARTADVRNLLFEKGAGPRATQLIECTKYFSKSGAPFLDNVPVLRVAEMYLIRAEAQAQPTSGAIFNETAALADVNVIRTNRGLTAATGLTGTALQDEILLQRRLEFCMEGHRFFDLKRLGKDISKSPFYANLLFIDPRVLPAIPVREVQLNPMILQNASY
jgi:starch-binding outer membrane protein, SusD/RagB family